jgi:hypothetical protein
MKLMIIITVIFYISRAHSACVSRNITDHIICNTLDENTPINVQSVLLKNNCDFQVDDWQSFSKNFSKLKHIVFSPPCRTCLKVDEHFPTILVEGRCLETKYLTALNVKQLGVISDEIASCIGFLVFLTLLYTFKFIKKEIFQQKCLERSTVV